MKIAIDIRSCGGEKTGKGWYTFYIVRHLLEIDKVNEYILYAKSGIAGFQEFKNAELIVINGLGPLWHTKVINDVKKRNIDIFFAPSSYIIPAMLPKEIKSIITVHDLVAFMFPQKHNKKAVILEKMFLKKALAKVTKVLTVSENTKKDLITLFNYEQTKIDTVYCSASDYFRPAKEPEETNLPKKFFLAVGTIEPRKNYKKLIQAFSQIAKDDPNYHLMIVGQNGWDYKEVYAEIKNNYLRKNVHILGYQSPKNLLTLYHLARALVFPSLYEGFGIPPLEAMKAGCPVICSNVASLPEVVGSSAILVDPKNEVEIYNAMLKIINEPEIRHVLKEQGLIQAQKFSWEASAKKLYDILMQL